MVPILPLQAAGGALFSAVAVLVLALVIVTVEPLGHIEDSIDRELARERAKGEKETEEL